MEVTSVFRKLIVMITVLGMVAGQNTATFQECYALCFVVCVINPNNSAFFCSLECLKDCIIPTSPLNTNTNTHYFCNLGCASSLCTNISTKHNPGEKKVEGCVKSCSGMCTKNYSFP